MFEKKKKQMLHKAELEHTDPANSHGLDRPPWMPWSTESL